MIEKVESLAEEQEQSIMHNSISKFEWSPGVKVEDMINDDQEEILTIMEEPPMIERGQKENHMRVKVRQESDQIDNDGDGIINDDDERLFVVQKDNIVTEKADIIEHEVEQSVNNEEISQQGKGVNELADEVAVADLDDKSVEPKSHLSERPRSNNARAGVGRIQMEFQGKRL